MKNKNELVSQYGRNSPTVQSSYREMPTFVNELFDFYYSMGPDRTLDNLFKNYIELCDKKDIEPIIDRFQLNRIASEYLWNDKIIERNSQVSINADRKAESAAIEAVLPQRILIKRKQLDRLTRMEQFAELVIDALIERAPSLKTADLKTLGEFGKLAQSFIAQAHKEENIILEEGNSEGMTKDEILNLIPYELKGFIEGAAKQLLGEFK